MILPIINRNEKTRLSVHYEYFMNTNFRWPLSYYLPPGLRKKKTVWNTKAKKKIQIGRDLAFRLSPWSEYCFLVLVFLHGVRGEFTDEVSETAVGPIFTGHDQWRWLWNLWSLELLSQVLDLLKAHTVQHSAGKCVQTLMCLRNFKLHNFKKVNKIRNNVFWNARRVFPCRNKSAMARRRRKDTAGR